MDTANIGRGHDPDPEAASHEAEPEFSFPQQAVRDVDNSFISAALWEIERRIDSLPPAAEAIARFPTHHHHTFNAAKLHAMADWLADFACLWRQNIEEPSNGETGSAAA
jgi:hypothetical protein